MLKVQIAKRNMAELEKEIERTRKCISALCSNEIGRVAPERGPEKRVLVDRQTQPCIDEDQAFERISGNLGEEINKKFKGIQEAKGRMKQKGLMRKSRNV